MHHKKAYNEKQQQHLYEKNITTAKSRFNWKRFTSRCYLDLCLVSKSIWSYFIGIYSFFFTSFFFNLAALKAVLYVSLFWFLFELYNFLGPLLSKRGSNSDMLLMPKKDKYIFKPKWSNVALYVYRCLFFCTR